MTGSKPKQYLISELALMKDWDFDENQDLNPAALSVGSNKRAAWNCHLCNNKWKTSIYHRATKHTGCRKCSSVKRLNLDIDESVFKTHPDIASDWSPDKNGQLSPKMFSKNSRYEASWCCNACGAEKTTSIRNYNGCKQCRVAKLLEKKNLELEYPELSREWAKKNGDKLPSDFMPASNKFAWWLCSKCGHGWSAKIANRASFFCNKCQK